MKRIVCLILAAVFLLSGCSLEDSHLREPVNFYYVMEDYPYGTQEGVIVSEAREAAGHRNDLAYLMALYLMGPSGDELKSPLPNSARIYGAEFSDQKVSLRLSEMDKALSDSEFTLACACLALTCMELTGAQSVSITSGDRNLEMDRESLVLFDSSTAAAEEENQ